MKPEKTSDLMALLKETDICGLNDFLKGHQDPYQRSDRPFTDYMRDTIRQKGLIQHEIFRRADISERYGYKLLSMERKTLHRDYILRICIAAGFTLKETQRALRLYNMAELYPKVPRDAVLIVAINTGIRETNDVDELLAQYGQAPLRRVGAGNES